MTFDRFILAIGFLEKLTKCYLGCQKQWRNYLVLFSISNFSKIKEFWTEYSVDHFYKNPRPLTTHKKFESRVSTSKTHQMFSAHTTQEKFDNETIAGHFGFMFEENWVSEITWWSWRHSCSEASFSKCFPTNEKLRAVVFEFLRYKKTFVKISVFVTD